MADDTKPSNDGLSDAHRPAGDEKLKLDPVTAAKKGAHAALIEAAMGSFDAETEPDADQLDLLADSPFAGPVPHVAKIEDELRARGRKRGSKNKSNQLFRDAMLKMGYRHPGQNLMALANADPVQLAKDLGEPMTVEVDKEQRLVRDKDGSVVYNMADPVKCLDIIRKANADVMPYFESKRPTEMHVQETKLGVMVVGHMDVEKPDDGVKMSILGEVVKDE